MAGARLLGSVPRYLIPVSLRPITRATVSVRYRPSMNSTNRSTTSRRSSSSVSRLEARLPENPAWRGDEEVDGELRNPALADWYRYSYWTHRLRSRGRTHAVRMRSGGVAYLRLESYYCKPEGSGCLTFRYRFD